MSSTVDFDADSDHDPELGIYNGISTIAGYGH